MKITYYTRGEEPTAYLSAEYQSMYFKRENDDQKLWNDVGQFLAFLMSKGMEAKVHDEGVGIVVEWNYDPDWGDEDFGNDRLMWVSSEEEETILDNRQNDIDDIVKRLKTTS